ncbi:tRNA (adenosine(37)-N6)-dimethylallyltransferase MiaA [Streptococcus sciuri]|uniref:tRNA dimethylallyltransferase n=1 Tax=Streptococcus sciuri TaxID=2973939 RepID=A0ABT2F4S5_9STRE|nr:tRNA (adenosine(37)-N6)-dimethylallyltransferase MiaA [Streptococcus sciuri]MCS4487385.1 tRNA (adenosine(37)-N6)-dimethylallyltransferase MiaA [Streptococcus sciuri]
MSQKLICVVGPTAVGKTALGVELAQIFDGEIISGDSQQVYRQLDIGTAKASEMERALAIHHLIDVREVFETYSAFDFVKEATKAITDIANRGRVPIIVGGTGLYLQSLLEGYHLGGKGDQKAILAYRRELEKLSNLLLKKEMNVYGISLPLSNRRRVIRALELARFGMDMENQTPDYDVLIIGLNDEREKLYKRINNRVDQMVKDGLVEEARWLYQTYPHVQASRAIGYKELFPYFEGVVSWDEALDKLKQNTRRFAKRQLTWFRNRMAVDFYNISDDETHEAILNAVHGFLEN